MGASNATRPTSDAVLSVVIPTIGRTESLRETLRCLAQRTGSERAEVVVVENSSDPKLTPADVSVHGLNTRLLHEPRPGKCFALNRAIEAGVGEITAVLDDDMSPMPGWIDTVISSVRSRPQFDIFSGRSHVVWPAGTERPPWADHWLAQGVAFSVLDWGPADREMGVGNVQEPSGNHFWFRRSVLASVPAFPDLWPPENPFLATARACGHRGVFVPEVTCGHRIQPELIDARAFLERVGRFGRALVQIERARAGGPTGNDARATRLGSIAGWLVWWLRFQRARLLPVSRRVPAQAGARMRMAYRAELLRQR